jgi:uncharacterized protein (DUF58 family)
MPGRTWRKRLAARWREGIRHRVTLLGAMMAGLLATSGILAVVTGQNVFFLLASLLLTAILVSGFVNRLMLAGLEVKLELPEHVMAGEPVACQLVVQNAKHWLASFALEITAPVGKRFYLPVVPARGKAAVGVEVIWGRRGVPEPVEVDLSTRFPFGFSQRRTRVLVRVGRALYPSIREQEGFAAVLAMVEGWAGQRGGRQESEYSHLREYVAGDDWRRIAWGKSAAVGDWVVRESERSGGAELRLWLDEGSPEFERLVELTAYLVWNLEFAGKRFSLRVGGEEFEVNRAGGAYTILRKLAVVQPRRVEVFQNENTYFVLSYRSGDLLRTDAGRRGGERRQCGAAAADERDRGGAAGAGEPGIDQHAG